MGELKNLSILAKTGFLLNEEKTLKETLMLGFKLFFILYIIKISSGLLVVFLDLQGVIELPPRIQDEDFLNYHKYIQLFIMVGYAPIIEELIFRLGLRFSKVNFSILFIGLLYLLLRIYFRIEISYASVLALTMWLIFYVFICQINTEFISAFWKRNRLLIFYGLLSVFSTMHLLNYNFSMNHFKLIPILVFPHFIGGFIYSYARLNSGIILAIILHSLNNGLPRIVSLFTD